MNDKPARRGYHFKRLAIFIAVITCGLLAWLLSQSSDVPAASNAPLTASSPALPAAVSNGLPQVPVLASNSTVTAPGGRVLNSSREFDLAVNPYAAALREPGRSKRAWETDFLQRQNTATNGNAIQFELTEGVMASGVVKIVQRDGNGITYMSGELNAPESGKFFFLRPPAGGRAGSAVGVIEFPASKTAYRIEPTGDQGAPELWRRRMDEVVCMMPLAENGALDETENAPPLRPDLVPEIVPSYNSNIVSLQSLPSSSAVLMLDFFGGYTPTWGGVSYPAPNIGNAAIRDVWKRVAEDFMPLNINVTTDRKVYEAAPATSRQRCVFSPDIVILPTAAGVAYIGSWNWGSDTVCWAKYTTGKAAAEVGSHEVGHTLSLGHKDTTTAGYYGGHGSGATGWGPIMGVGYYQPVTTWSKGEFLDAVNTVDELATMITHNNVAYRVDDIGDTLATSRHLEIANDLTASGEAVIQNTGEADAFQFYTTGGTANLTANVVGDWANLAVMVEIQNSGGVTIASNNPAGATSAGVSASLSAGDYTFKVTGMGRNSPLTNGFSDYGSLGYYSISGNVAGARVPSRFSIAERSPNGTTVGTVTSTNLGVHALNYVITGGTSNNAFALDNNGVLTVANSTALLYANLAYGSQSAVQYELFVNIIDTVDPLRTELNRRVVVQVLDVAEAVTQLIHRWGFTNGTDSVGGANATLVGTATYSGGKLQIPGGAPRANCATVNLTNTLGTNISLTIEGWFTMTTLQNWSKVWMFGRANGGAEPGLAYLEFTPLAGADGDVPSMSLNTGLRSSELNIRTGNNPAVLTTGVEYHAVCVYDSVSSLMSLYLNGVLADSASMVEANITQIAATEAYFGAAVNYGDNNLNGAINEIRIYNGPRTSEQIAISYAAGPNTLVTNPGAVVALRLVVPNTNMVSLSTQSVTVFADYANITNVNVTSAGVVYTTGSSNTVAADSSGSIRAIVPGTTTLTASFGGTNVSRSLTVTNILNSLAHRWNFNDGTDTVGGANATLVGSASYAGGKLLVPGGVARSNSATVNIAGTLNSTVNLTVETWFTMNTLQDWAKVWMFGRAASGAGEPWLSFIDFTPRTDGSAGNIPSISFNPTSGNAVDTRTVPNPVQMTNGGEYHAVATYDAVSNLMSVYINGTLVDSASMGGGNITQVNPNEAYFGAAVNYGDPCLNGSINELRIWKGVLPASQIAFNASAGPDTVVTNPGALLAVRLVVTNTTMPRATTQPTSVFADFVNYTNLNVGNSGVTYSSSNPGVVTVSASGVLTAVESGMATVTAFYGSTNGTRIITVTGGGASVLAHRWSFSDGTDSVGGANAILVGSASYSGGKLQIPGGAARVNGATANITNTLAANSSITIEGWFTMTTLQNWSKVWMFGKPNGGAQPGLAYVDFTPRRGDGTSVPSIALDTALSTEVNTGGGVNPAIMSANVEYHVAAIYNSGSNMMSLYINGALVDSASMNGGNITQLQATEAWFGAAVYWGDPNLNGTINELRIWNGPLTSAQVATNYQLGPNVLPRPTLNVAKNAGSVVLSWPEIFPGYTLQSSPVVGTGATWNSVSNSPALAGGSYSVTLSATNQATFFRLAK